MGMGGGKERGRECSRWETVAVLNHSPDRASPPSKKNGLSEKAVRMHIHISVTLTGYHMSLPQDFHFLLIYVLASR